MVGTTCTRHRSRGLHRQPPRRSARAGARCGRSFATTRATTAAGSRSSPTVLERWRSSRGDLANPEAVAAPRGLRLRPPPRRADPDPVLVPPSPGVRDHERRGDVERAGGLPPADVGASCTRRSSEVYGTAHNACRSTRSTRSAAVAVRRDEGRRRPARVELLAVVRHAGGRRAAVQHVRAAAVGAGRHPDNDHAGDDRETRSSSARPSPHATSLRRGHRPRE